MGERIGNWIKVAAKRFAIKLLASPVFWAIMGGILLFALIIFLVMSVAAEESEGDTGFYDSRHRSQGLHSS